jgi:hypothetical protein
MNPLRCINYVILSVKGNAQTILEYLFVVRITYFFYIILNVLLSLFKMLKKNIHRLDDSNTTSIL